MPDPVIEYVKPTSRAMGRMTTILFRPFDLGKWFVLGFTAWLAALLDGGGGGSGGGNTSGGGGFQDGEFNESEGIQGIEQFYEPARTFLEENLSWIIPLAVILFVLAVVISVVLLWVSSRGKFMFLDNVVYNRALVVEPWKKFRSTGNSLFWWRLVFGLLVLFLILAVIGGAALFLIPAFDGENITASWIGVLVASVLVLMLIALAAIYISILLEDFVIPMMYRDRLYATQAWGRVLSLHNSHPGSFLLYFLWKAVLGMAAVMIVIVAVLATCCMAGIILAIPYLGAVLMLPITVFFRGLGPEFLRQFGEEYDLWHGSEDDFSFRPGD